MNQYVSAPILYYIILLLLSVLLMGISVAFIKNPPLDNFLTNLGYGIFCSTFVAALVDFGTTHRKNKKDINDYFLLTRRIRAVIIDLISFRLEYGQYIGNAFANIEYYRWIYLFLNPETKLPDTDNLNDIFFDCCKHLLIEAESLKGYTSVLIGNHLLKEDFFFNLEGMISRLRFIVNNRKITRMGSIELFNCLVGIFPEVEEAFLKKWDKEKIMQLYLKQLNYDFSQYISFTKDN